MGATKYLGGELTNPPIGEAAALHALENVGGALCVALVLGRVAKIELGKVAVHVSGAHVVIGADNAALEDAEEVLGGVAVVTVATAELADAVKRGAVLRELAPNVVIETGIVRHEDGGTVRVGDQRGANVGVIDMRDVERTGATAALN